MDLADLADVRGRPCDSTTIPATCETLPLSFIVFRPFMVRMYLSRSGCSSMPALFVRFEERSLDFL